jgi:hypothetical protein
MEYFSKAPASASLRSATPREPDAATIERRLQGEADLPRFAPAGDDPGQRRDEDEAGVARHHGDVGRVAELVLEFKGGGESGMAASDHDDACHGGPFLSGTNAD